MVVKSAFYDFGSDQSSYKTIKLILGKTAYVTGTDKSDDKSLDMPHS